MSSKGFANIAILVIVLLAAAGVGYMAILQQSRTAAPATAVPSQPLALVAPSNPWNPPVTNESPQGLSLYGGWAGLRMLPSPVHIEGGWLDSSYISANGKRLYVAYTACDFFEMLMGGGCVASGPRLSGMRGDGWDMFQAEVRNGRWEIQRHPASHEDPSVHDASAGVNGAEDVMVFTRWNIFGRTDGNIWMSVKNPQSGWGYPSPFPAYVNTPCEEDEPHVIGSFNERRLILYFRSGRLNEQGTSCGDRKRIFYSSYNFGIGGTGWGAVREVPGVNLQEDSQPFVTEDGREIYWLSIRNNRPGIFRVALLPNGTYGNTELIMEPTPMNAPSLINRIMLVGEISVARLPEGDIMYFMCGIGRNRGGAPRFSDINDIDIEVCVAKKHRVE